MEHMRLSWCLARGDLLQLHSTIWIVGCSDSSTTEEHLLPIYPPSMRAKLHGAHISALMESAQPNVTGIFLVIHH